MIHEHTIMGHVTGTMRYLKKQMHDSSFDRRCDGVRTTGSWFASMAPRFSGCVILEKLASDAKPALAALEASEVKRAKSGYFFLLSTNNLSAM